MIDIVKEIVISAKPLFFDREKSSEVSVKGRADYVTKVDLAVQNYIGDKLREKFPDIQFLAEEKDNSDIDLSGKIWILDPVDGTTNLIHDFKGSSISLALCENKEVVLGVVYLPFSDEIFYAEKGKGAYLNGERCYCSEEKELSEALVSIGSSPYVKSWAKANFEMFRDIFLATSDVRRIGSAAIELCYVACGRAEAYVEASLKPWDYAAGKLIVEEAGGYISDYKGGKPDPTIASSMVAANKYLGREFVERFTSKLVL